LYREWTVSKATNFLIPLPRLRSSVLVVFGALFLFVLERALLFTVIIWLWLWGDRHLHAVSGWRAVAVALQLSRTTARRIIQGTPRAQPDF